MDSQAPRLSSRHTLSLTTIASRLAPTRGLLNGFLAFERLLQRLHTALFGGIQLKLHLFDVQQLLFKLLTTLTDFRQHAVQLLGVTAGGVVELDQFAAFSQRET